MSEEIPKSNTGGVKNLLEGALGLGLVALIIFLVIKWGDKKIIFDDDAQTVSIVREFFWGVFDTTTEYRLIDGRWHEKKKGKWQPIEGKHLVD